ncbi:MAG: T9SS type A sorting domain-containing protein [Bacteroidales bacterium]|nr:T9SS type A sorting domain-containing protein [Bacteroidales bacterium]MEE0992407.1 T9SS type A sorting domain-containing protein [Bacteroidales bacterium]
MKKTFVLIVMQFALIISLSLKAQTQSYEYIPIVKEGLQIWTTDQKYGQYNEQYSYERLALTEEDTIIDGKSYKKLYSFTEREFDIETATFVCGIRENENKQVFVASYHNQSEFLLYDFSLTEGDSILAESNGEYDLYFNVTDVDTIDYNGVERRKITLQFYNYAWVTWIEGIGNIEGLLMDWRSYTMAMDPMPNVRLRCYEYNEECLYSDFSFNESIYDCYTPLYTGLEENETQNNILLYPNPAKERLYINTSIPIKQMTICNLLGQEIQKYNNLETTSSINISGLNEGVYFVKLSTEKGVYATKIIVE